MAKKPARITVSLNAPSEKALDKITKRDTVEGIEPKVSASVRKALINESKVK